MKQPRKHIKVQFNIDMMITNTDELDDLQRHMTAARNVFNRILDAIDLFRLVLEKYEADNLTEYPEVDD